MHVFFSLGQNGDTETEGDGWLDAEEFDAPQNIQDQLYGDGDDEEFYDEEDEIFSEEDDLDQVKSSKKKLADDSDGEESNEAEDLDVDMELCAPEKVSAEALKVVESRMNIESSNETAPIFAPAKSAPELHFALINSGLELALRLTDRLLEDAEPSTITSALCTPIWRALLKVEKKQITPREEMFSTLLLANEQDEDENITERSALLTPLASGREWVARVSNRLLKTELSNQGEFKSTPVFKSTFFSKSKSIVTRVSAILLM